MIVTSFNDLPTNHWFCLLNSIHPKLKFNYETEVENKIPCLDVMENRSFDVLFLW